MSSNPLLRINLASAQPTIRGKISMVSASLQNGTAVVHVTIQPGGSWSRDLKPHVGTDSCQKTHTGFVLKGTLGVRMDDGKEEHFSSGDAFGVLPGHDAWCVGDEETVFVEWSAA